MTTDDIIALMMREIQQCRDECNDPTTSEEMKKQLREIIRIAESTLKFSLNKKKEEAQRSAGNYYKMSMTYWFYSVICS